MKLAKVDECGSAILEFLVIGVLVLMPILYVLLTVVRVESAVLASTQAVREAGRAFTMADSESQGRLRALAAARLSLSDQGFDLSPEALRISCRETCLAPWSSAHIRLDWRVNLPWLPNSLGGADVGYPITVESEVRIDHYRSDSSVT